MRERGGGERGIRSERERRVKEETDCKMEINSKRGFSFDIYFKNREKQGYSARKFKNVY